MRNTDKAPLHHPSETTLLAYASGRIAVAHGLVVAVHVGRCVDCQRKIGVAQKLGGFLLDDLEPKALQQDALQRCLTEISLRESDPNAHRASRLTTSEKGGLPNRVDDFDLPIMLRDLRPSSVRWLMPGVRHAILQRDDRGTLHFLRVRPNVMLPPHTHCGLELTCVLEGAFHDGAGQYRVGDVSEVGDEDTEQRGIDHHHVVVADPPGDCVCIVATSGRLRFKSWVARLFQLLHPL